MRQSLTVMVRVIHAIIIREARTRYGSSQLGYLWALIDPVILLIVLIAVFAAIGRSTPIAVPLPVFFLSGIMPFYYWRGGFSRGATAVSANLGLISYPQVMPSDIIIGRTLLEGATTLIVFFIIINLFYLVLGIPLAVYFGDPVQMLLATAGLFYFTLGFAFLSAGIGRILPVWSNIQSYISRPLLILSGVFFTLEQLPSSFRQYMAYNPVAHQIEWMRTAMFESFDSNSYSVTFVLASATIALLLGLIIDRMLLLTGDEEIVS
ncbi:MAG: ABC transporter permease [Sphingomonadales bacterium]|nr:ABC transporter permease [Sphingomonadales bacterium]